MRRSKGNVSYFCLLFIGIILALAGVDLARHVLVSGTPPPHSHVRLEHLVIMGFCAALFATERLGHFQLNIRLYLLALFLVVARLVYEFQRGGWEKGPRYEVALFLLLVPLLIMMVRHPVRVLRSEEDGT
jgi:hypothetical protein